MLVKYLHDKLILNLFDQVQKNSVTRNNFYFNYLSDQLISLVKNI
jgi:hypothetical protein